MELNSKLALPGLWDETLISKLAEAASRSGTETSSVKDEFGNLVEQARAEIAGSQTYTQGMLDVANGSIGVLSAKVELHSTQFGALTGEHRREYRRNASHTCECARKRGPATD